MLSPFYNGALGNKNYSNYETRAKKRRRERDGWLIFKQIVLSWVHGIWLDLPAAHVFDE